MAQVGIDAGRPILDSISGLMGYISFFENFVQIVVLLFAWIVVLLAFFILAIQLFVTLIEFKLTTLAGFVLIPFGLFGKTAFAAERVLGNVISSGVKVLVLAVIVGIGSTLFSQFAAALAATSRPSKMPWRWYWRHCLCWGSASSVPASPMALFPEVRSSVRVRLLEPASRLAESSRQAQPVRPWLRAPQAEHSQVPPAVAHQLPPVRPLPIARGGIAGLAQAGGSAIAGSLRRSASAAASNAANAGQGAVSPGSSSAAEPPAWAARMKRSQTVSHGTSAATHAVRSADHGGGGASVDLSEGER